MDADTRHQLKQNELAEALARIRDFSDRRTLTWLGVILLIALAYAGYKYWRWRQEAQMVSAFEALASVNAVDTSRGDAPLAQLRQLITDSSDPGLVSLSRLQLARGLESRGRTAEGAAKLAEAEAEYRAILATPEAPNLVKAAAVYRLGIMYETRRDFAKARESHTMLTADQRFAGSPFVDLAAARLELLDKLAVSIKFEPGFKPLPPAEPTSQAALPPATSAPAEAAPDEPAAATTQPAADNELTETGETGEPAPTGSNESQQP